jgi:CelD/BcsL family acetyltransferase involved in cellulose biosynthesis
MAFHFVVLENSAELRAHVSAWEDLAANAVEPNVFYEPWLLMPALDAYARGERLRIVLVYADDARGPALLCGLFPLQPAGPFRGLPLRYLRLWRHRHCYLATPLVRRGHAHACLGALLDWLAEDARGAGVMEWGLVGAGGPFHQALEQVLEQTSRRSFVSQQSERAYLRPRADAESFLEKALPGKRRKEYRRLERRLADLGALEYATLDRAVETPAWIAQFLELEASGWKGQRGSALGSSQANRDFFERAASAAAERGRLMMLALRLSGRPIAMKCNFLAGDGAFTFKIAYDEAYAQYSPGLLLELENIRCLHRTPALGWMDSCAEAGHFMANRLWLDRRALMTLVTASRRTAGEVVVSSLPVLRWIARSLRAPAPV